MLVRDSGSAWQLVEQIDHAALAGQLAAAWGAGPFASASRSLIRAAHRHDDGWALWDRCPLLNADGSPLSFLQAPVPPLLRAYQACADAVADEDPHAGLLVSLHISGLRRGRYGRGPGSGRQALRAAEVNEDPRITRFVADEEGRQATLRKILGLPREQEAHEYALLQLFDILSLHFCLSDLDAGQGRVFDRVATVAGAADSSLELTPHAPRHIRVEPWPFGQRPLRLSLRRRQLPREHFTDVEALRAAWTRTVPEVVPIELI